MEIQKIKEWMKGKKEPQFAIVVERHIEKAIRFRDAESFKKEDNIFFFPLEGEAHSAEIQDFCTDCVHVLIKDYGEEENENDIKTKEIPINEIMSMKEFCTKIVEKRLNELKENGNTED